VYVASSSSVGRVKVGMTTDLEERGKQLNTYRYGGASDWRIVSVVWVERAGEVECKTQYALKDKAVAASYFKAGTEIECHELFACDVQQAKKALMKNLPEGSSLKEYR
jgi:hypothetical protein